MATLKFKDLRFREKEDFIEVIFLRQYCFEIDKEELLRIGEFKVHPDFMEFDANQEQAEKKFHLILDKNFKNLKNKFNGKPTTYVHRNSGIPLLGHVSFGIIDRGTRVIEVKPQTGCNIKCVYCSVNEDVRPHDFVIEKDYLLEELNKVMEKKKGKVDLHIGTSSEVFMYEPFDEMVEDLAKNDKVKVIAVSTNGMYLTKSRVDKLSEISKGKIRFNISLNAFTKEMADKIAGAHYPLEKVKEMCEYIQKLKNDGKANLIIAPVWMPGINDEDIDKIAGFSKKIRADLMIQNFLPYKHGRNPVKGVDFDKFAEFMKKLENKHDIKLLHSELPEEYKKAESVEVPFRKNEIIKADIFGPGRLPGEKIAVARNRVISVYNANGKKSARIKILRTKNNLIIGECV